MTLSALVFPLLALAAPASEGDVRDAVAIAISASGVPTAQLAGEAPRQVRRLSRFPNGTLLVVPQGSHVTLALWSGRRYVLTGPARARLEASGLRDATGDTEELPPLPPLPRLPRLADGEEPGSRLAAIRLRADEIGGLDPSRGSTALADGLMLRFQPVPGATAYQVKILDQEGDAIFEGETTSVSLAVAAGTLRGGQRYSWTVRALDAVGTELSGRAEFLTLPDDTARARAALAEAARSDDEAELVLADLDRELRLWPEARDGFQRALARAPGDAVLAASLSAIEDRLKEDGAR